MSRPIKFRVWDGEGMRYPTGGDGPTEYSEIGLWWREDSHSWDFTYRNPGDIASSVMSGHEKAALLQFTGHHDADGKEIYEGDVVEYPRAFGGKLDRDRGVVEMVYGAWRVNGSLVFHEYCRVIGNIYENPELLEASE